MKMSVTVSVNKTSTNLFFALFLICSFCSFAIGQTDDFKDRPWQNEKYQIIIDPYEKNAPDFDKIINDKKVVGVLHQASRGLKHQDSKYQERAEIAKTNGLLYASYHLGLKGDGLKQADIYLGIIGENKSQPMALDIEGIDGKNISLKEAKRFINEVFKKTGKYPFVYVNYNVFKTISRDYDKKSAFAKCPLWLAWFKDALPPMSKKVWDKVTLWQFASELNCQVCLQTNQKGECIKRDQKYTEKCPYKILGNPIPYDMDINVFNGTSNELKEFWVNS